MDPDTNFHGYPRIRSNNISPGTYICQPRPFVELGGCRRNCFIYLAESEREMCPFDGEAFFSSSDTAKPLSSCRTQHTYTPSSYSDTTLLTALLIAAFCQLSETDDEVAQAAWMSPDGPLEWIRQV